MSAIKSFNIMVAGQSAGPMAATDQKIRSFASLPLGWHYGNGAPAPESLIRIARNYHNLFLTLGFSETDAFPGIDGEIMVTAYRGKNCIELTVGLDRDFVVTHECGGQEKFHEHGLSEVEATEALGVITANIEQEECNTLYSFTSSITTHVLNNSRIWPLKRQMTGAALQLFWSRAVPQQAEQFAPIYANSTQVLEASRQYFGDFVPIKSMNPVISSM